VLAVKFGLKERFMFVGIENENSYVIIFDFKEGEKLYFYMYI
jgi:hypothetical protein